jgi:CPA1 family monovalent cation:H+ antiporter
MQRRALILTRRVNAKIRRTTPLVSENEVHVHMRDLQLNALEYVIDHLYDEMGQNPDDTEYCSALILDYRRAETALRARPSVAVSTKLLTQIDEAKHESYAIELGIIRDMVESGEVSRAQAKHLRRNVYVMQVDADSEL